MSLRCLFIDMNSFFASVEQQENPDLQGKPVIVVPMLSEGTCAIAASYEAKRFGIRTGTPVAMAKRLCPNVVMVEAKHERYVTYHHRIMAEIDRHVPIAKIASIDEAYCRLIGREQTPDNAQALAMRIKAGIHQKVGAQLLCSIGIAPNRLLAKLAAESQKPNGLVLLPMEEVEAFIRTCALDDVAGIGKAMTWRLYKAGITTLHAFWQVSPRQARALWGSVEGERLWAMLHGLDVPETVTERSTVGHSHVLAPLYRSPPAAYCVARRLTFKAGSRLRRLGYDAQSFIVSVRLESGGRYDAEVRFTAACDNTTFAEALAQGWQQFASMLRGQRVKKVGVLLMRLQPQQQRHTCPSLWTPSPAATPKRERLSHALDALNQRFGANTILPADIMRVQMGFPVGTKVAFNRIPENAEFRE
jgi:DNA polymerase-4